jgi:hypothetical protein
MTALSIHIVGLIDTWGCLFVADFQKEVIQTAGEHEARQRLQVRRLRSEVYLFARPAPEPLGELHSDRTSGAVPAQGHPMTGHSAASHETQWGFLSC